MQQKRHSHTGRWIKTKKSVRAWGFVWKRKSTWLVGWLVTTSPQPGRRNTKVTREIQERDRRPTWRGASSKIRVGSLTSFPALRRALDPSRRRARRYAHTNTGPAFYTLWRNPNALKSQNILMAREWENLTCIQGVRFPFGSWHLAKSC